MTVRCGWCGRKLQRKEKPNRVPLCREHVKYRAELEAVEPYSRRHFAARASREDTPHE